MQKIRRIRTWLYAFLFAITSFSVLVSAAIGALAAGGDKQINLFFPERDAATDSASCPDDGEPCRESKDVVIPGGMPFGVKMYAGGPIASDFSDIEKNGKKTCPARDAGIMKGDVITEVGGKSVVSAEDVVKAICSTEGETEIKLSREGKEKKVTVTPVRGEDGIPRIGLMIKDCTAGIGTVTFIVPETGEFMGLGHGICDSETGELVPLIRGIVSEVNITGAKKGESGEPGELKGDFTKDRIGAILKNTDVGVVGVFSNNSHDVAKTICVGSSEDVEEGEAYILSTVDPGGVRKYSIEIERAPRSESERNFELRVTDPELLRETGGIVQGMSGSPIIQNGKLVGALTHVMINDPKRGYGILIEKMIKEFAA